MSKVIIFGTGKAAESLISIINDNTQIIAYADNDKNKWNNLFYGKLVIQPNNITNYKFDYILIASQFEAEIYKQLKILNINKKSIFKYIQYTDNYFDNIKYYMEAVVQYSNEVELLITGISYAQYGFSSSYYKDRVAINIANGSQDLYYDYNLVKYLINKNKLNKLNKVIIGLCYYSFQYDMSLSSLKNKVALYYKNINLYHHNSSIKSMIDELKINEMIAQNVLNFDSEEKPILKFNKVRYVLNDKMGKNQAEIDCNKNYPKTVEENIKIFKEYLQLLKDNNIKPIVVIFPASKYYASHFSKRIEDEFHNIISEVSKEYEFQYVDYFRSDLFDDDDFRDVSHLNPNGTEKFTQILEKIIE